MLLSVTGIGPKVAQSILANSDASSIASAILSSNLKFLEAVPGLGKKSAQRLVLELKDKVSVFASGKTTPNVAISSQVENALRGFLYIKQQANRYGNLNHWRSVDQIVLYFLEYPLRYPCIFEQFIFFGKFRESPMRGNMNQ